jgi:hypothetical protein
MNIARKAGRARAVLVAALAVLGLVALPASPALAWAGVGQVYASPIFNDPAPRCLDDPNGSKAVGQQIIAYTCGPGSRIMQNWAYEGFTLGGGLVFMLRNDASGLCLSTQNQVKGSGIVQLPCNSNDHRTVWRKLRSNPPYPQPLRMQNYHSALCVNIEHASRADNARILQWSCETSWNNNWYLSGA